jgi:hypothetical protein
MIFNGRSRQARVGAGAAAGVAAKGGAVADPGAVAGVQVTSQGWAGRAALGRRTGMHHPPELVGREEGEVAEVQVVEAVDQKETTAAGQVVAVAAAVAAAAATRLSTRVVRVPQMMHLSPALGRVPPLGGRPKAEW